MSTKPKIKIILGSTRQNRAGEKVAAWVMASLQKDDRADLELLDLRDWQLPYYDEPTSPSRVTDGQYPNELVRAWGKKIADGDGFIIITPEYNHGYPAVLKSALDAVYKEWNKKAVAFISYGGPGAGVRAVEQLRLVAIELQMAPVEQAVLIPRIREAFDEAGQPQNPMAAQSLQNLFTSLLWWAEALRTARAKG
jgi:NAD(P)H-dependent FMN reductase